MSHIPSSAMPHAKPIEPEDGAAAETVGTTDGAASVADTPPVVVATLGGAVEDATPAAADLPSTPPVDATSADAEAGSGLGWGLIAALAGGAVALGAVAAAAVPLVRGHAAPKRERRKRKADRKAKVKG